MGQKQAVSALDKATIGGLLYDSMTVAGVPIADLGGAFRGALLHLTSDQSIGSSTAVPWDAADYDTDSFFDLGGNPTRLTVPAGVSHVVLTGGQQTNNTGAATQMAIFLKKNGATFPGTPIQLLALAANSSIFQSLASPPLEVTPGDYFEFFYQPNGAGSGLIAGDFTYFAIQAVG